MFLKQYNNTNLSVPGHLNAGIKELIKVLAELAGSHCQLAAGASRGVNHLTCRLVQVRCCLVQLTLSLLKRLGGWRDLNGRHRQEVR